MKNMYYENITQRKFAILIPVKVDFKERILQEINSLLFDDKSDDLMQKREILNVHIIT